jgi:hypothetical protein
MLIINNNAIVINWIIPRIRILLFNPEIIIIITSLKRPTAWRSADWPTLQDYLHYTYSPAKEHTNVNAKPKANSVAAPGWAEYICYMSLLLNPNFGKPKAIYLTGR